MYPRTNYEMTEDDLKTILASMQSVPMIMLNIDGGRSPQDRANDAWKSVPHSRGDEPRVVLL